MDRWSEADAADSESQLEHNQDAEFSEELMQLALLTNGQPTDADRDIDFAYRNMALLSVTPLMAPSTHHRTTHRVWGIKDLGFEVIFPGPYVFHAIARSLTRCRPSQSVCVPGWLAFFVERIT